MTLYTLCTHLTEIYCILQVRRLRTQFSGEMESTVAADAAESVLPLRRAGESGVS